ncbi:hypothetical protein SNE40_016615 [Patella caerulea]|uniref:PiggyBac transposable element-derived protein domain-containing protein n=1 Tax=Patella caerulea TaxID=87958 RepID=A0AAN8JEI1_PATCE
MSKLYAQQKGNENFDMTPSDFKLCIGVILLSGYNPVPQKRMYWENSDDVRNDIVASAFPYKRFEELVKHIHLADNTKLDHSDKMAKLRPLIDRLNVNFLKLWPASQNVNVDESMISYYGRHSSKQFIQNKPIRYGYKVWCLNTPPGYLIQYNPYRGVGTDDIRPELGMGGSVVVDLLCKLPAKCYNVYFDNLFTSLPLIETLK